MDEPQQGGGLVVSVFAKSTKELPFSQSFFEKNRKILKKGYRNRLTNRRGCGKMVVQKGAIEREAEPR